MPFVTAPSVSQQTTQAGANILIDRALELLLSGEREDVNKLAITVAQGAEALTFVYPLGGIRRGSQIEIDLELFRVWDVDADARTAEVQPGLLGTETAAHTARTLVAVNPRFPRSSIFKAINEELTALSAPGTGLYAIAYMDLAATPSSSEYALDVDVEEIISVQQQVAGSTEWVTVPSWRFAGIDDPAKFASGNSLHCPWGEAGATLRVLYKSRFKTLPSASSDIHITTGLPPEMQDIVVFGAMLRVGAVREIKRNFTEAQGDTRRPEEVPPNAVVSSFRNVRAQYESRIMQEAQRLALRYGMRRTHHVI